MPAMERDAMEIGVGRFTTRKRGEKKDYHDSTPPRQHTATTHAHHYYMVYIAAVYKGDGASCASLHYRRRIAP